MQMATSQKRFRSFPRMGGVIAQIGWTNVSGIVSVMTETKHQSQRTTPQNSSAVHYFCNRWRNARTCHATPGRKNSRKQTLGVKRVVGAAWTRKTLYRTFDELLNGSCQVNPVTLVIVLNWFLCRLKKMNGDSPGRSCAVKSIRTAGGFL